MRLMPLRCPAPLQKNLAHVRYEAVGRMAGPGYAAVSGWQTPCEERSVRQVLRFGAKITGADVPTVPARFRGMEGPAGRLVGVRLRAATGATWLRVKPPLQLGRKRELLTVPLNASQSPAPTPDAIELRGGMRVTCHEGYAGQLEGLAVESTSGIAVDLLVHVRSDVLADVDRPTSPLSPLIAMAGRRILVPSAWAGATKVESRGLLPGTDLVLHLNASAEQIAASTLLRPDADVAAGIVAILSANPAVSPYAGRLSVTVRDGAVTLRGKLPSPRHRASAEQDVWHVPGVFALNDETTVSA